MSATSASIPHPFPYQGSKRGIAQDILRYVPPGIDRLIEPFCGAAALSIAAAAGDRAARFHLSDLNRPLMSLWDEILQRPEALADQYEGLWQAQRADPRAYFLKIRARFNERHQPHDLLYLLARIVKGAVRYSADGAFNQSADHRRAGMRPATLRRQLLGVSALLAGRTTTASGDFLEAAGTAGPRDLVYLDPPYQGTSTRRDRRYIGGLSYDDFVAGLAALNRRDALYIVSYDGYTGGRAHGRALPGALGLRHLFIRGGRSAQSTLLGGADETVESLYLSPALTERLAAGAAGRRGSSRAAPRALAPPPGAGSGEEPHPTFSPDDRRRAST